MNRRNLYRVWLRGNIEGPYYVVAETVDAAVNEVIDEMNAQDSGFSRDRVLNRVELLAEQRVYSPVARLFIVPVMADVRPTGSDAYGDGK